MIAQFLDTNGDGSGTKNANGNYSGAAEIFYIQPAANVDMYLYRMIVSVEDTSGFLAENYGDLAGALTNGITVRHQDDSGTLVDLTDGIPVKTNAHWGRMCYDVDVKSWGSTPTNELLLARWTFERSGAPIKLESARGGRLEVVLNDDLSGLISHYFKVQGQSDFIG